MCSENENKDWDDLPSDWFVIIASYTTYIFLKTGKTYIPVLRFLLALS